MKNFVWLVMCLLVACYKLYDMCVNVILYYFFSFIIRSYGKKRRNHINFTT